MEQMKESKGIKQVLPRIALWAGAVITLLWLVHAAVTVILAFFFAMVLSIVLNAPVTWLEDKGLSRIVGTLLVVGLILGLVVFLFWLIMPRIGRQVTTLWQDFPLYTEQLRSMAEKLLRGYPSVQNALPLNPEKSPDLYPSLSTLLNWISNFSISLFTVIALLLVFFAVIIYTVLNPRPLLERYLQIFPPSLSDSAMRAFSRASSMVIGWIWANIVIGSIEAVAAGIVLSILGVPGALVWAALAFFAELVPKIGLYLMAVPPILVALATDPIIALWVGVFYLVLNEITGDFLAPRIRSSTMDLHPVSILFIMLILASAFGLAGALIATPVAAFIKAYYEEFYLADRPQDKDIQERVNAMLHRRVTTHGSGDGAGRSSSGK